MSTDSPTDVRLTTLQFARRNRERWLIIYALFLGLSLVLMRLALAAGPGPRVLSLLIFVLGSGAILYRPAIGVYLICFFALLGDGQLAWWYPFDKNFSSFESSLYLSDAFIISPLEAYIALTFASILLGMLGGRRVNLPPGPLLRPLGAFTGLALFALAFGLVRGGNVNVALWEVRPILYIMAVYLLASMLLTRQVHYHYLAWTVLAAVTLEALHAAYVINVSMAWTSGSYLEVLGYLQHSASLHFNFAIVLMLAAWVMRRGSWAKRLVVPICLVAIVPVYLAAERRSAVVALGGAVVLLACVLFVENRRAFWWVVPAVAICCIGYCAVFWNVQSGMGFPAQAIKSVVAPDQLAHADQESNAYREVETYNLVSTVRASPITGLGFGHMFHRPIPLPYIPFVWAEYMPHNSVLWIWINMGVVGFVSMLYLFSTAVSTGVRASAHLPVRDDAGLVLTAVLFAAMYLVYAYVDIAWDAQSMVLLGACFAMIDHMHRHGEHAKQDGEVPSSARLREGYGR